MRKFVVVLVLLFTTISNAQWKSSRIKGNGNLITKERVVKSFDKVSVGGSFTVKLIDGKEGKVTISAEENVLPYIITEVNGDNLKIQFKKNTNISTTKEIKVIVPFEKVSSLSISGSGDIISEKTIEGEGLQFFVSGSGDIEADVKANNIKATISGSGDIELSGITKDTSCNVSGSGDIKAYKLESDVLEAKVVGSGDIFVTVNEKIKATVVGSGDINYKGNPEKIKSKVVGSGDITNKN